VRPHPIGLPLALLVLTALPACNLSSAPVGNPLATSPPSTAPAHLPTTVVPTATIATPETPAPTPEPASPTPVDLSSFPSVIWMGRLSLTQGWVYSDGRLLWTDDAGSSWSDITPAGLSNCPEPDICSIVSPPVFLDSSRADCCNPRTGVRAPNHAVFHAHRKRRQELGPVAYR